MRFALVGTGWRAEFYERAARMLPDRFQMSGVLCHSEAGREKAVRQWKARVYESREAIILDKPDFVVVSVPGKAVADLAAFFANRDMPALFETYCSESADAMDALWKRVGGAPVQVAEQYPFQPMHQARIHVASSGALGKIYQARMSFIQNYHALAVLRRVLGVGMELPLVYGYHRENQRLAGPTRAGYPTEEKVESVKQEMFLLDYGDRTAIGDYESMQQRSWIRAPQFLIRGERGEIQNEQVTYLRDYLTPISYRLIRSQAGMDGNLEGDYLRGIQGEGTWLFTNPYIPVRMMDDEIAVASCLEAMGQYVSGGPAFYSLAEAFQDQYISLLIQEAARKNIPVQATRQIWHSGSM